VEQNILPQFGALLRSSNFRIFAQNKKKTNQAKKVSMKGRRKRKQVHCNERKSVMLST